MPNKKIVIVVNEDLFFLTHRKNLGLYLIQHGWDVTVMATKTSNIYSQKIRDLGFTFIELPIERVSSNPFKECKTLKVLRRTFKQIKPALIMNVGLKTILLGGLTARHLGIPVISAISGLGFLFTEGRKSWKQKILIFGLRHFLPKKKHWVIFQNEEDKAIFVKNKIAIPQKSFIIPGMGVDLSEYTQSDFELKENLNFLFAARMLKDKGLIEFIEAAKRIEAINSKVTFTLAGGIDLKNPTGISEKELHNLIENTSIKWIGFQKDMLPVYIESDIVVLPSYREGFPKVLIEACAIGRPVITTDAPGCRDCVEDGVNGFLVPVKDVRALSNAMKEFVEDPSLKILMGKESRLLACEKFDCNSINANFLQVFEQVTSKT